MTMDPQVRLMQESDIPEATALWAATEGVEVAEGDSLSELAAYLVRNPGMSHVSIFQGQLVGAVLAGHDGRRGFLYHLSVASACRGKGIGRSLVDASLAALKRAGVKRVLILVARDNAGGEAFWKRQGWETLEFAQPMAADL